MERKVKVCSQTGWGSCPDFPLDPPLGTGMNKFLYRYLLRLKRFTWISRGSKITRSTVGGWLFTSPLNQIVCLSIIQMGMVWSNGIYSNVVSSIAGWLSRRASSENWLTAPTIRNPVDLVRLKMFATITSIVIIQSILTNISKSSCRLFIRPSIL